MRHRAVILAESVFRAENAATRFTNEKPATSPCNKSAFDAENAEKIVFLQ